METALPNLHPAVVHFPIALIVLALPVQLLAVWGPAWRRKAAAGWWSLGAVTATLAWVAGRLAADDLVGVPPHLQPHISDHADWATILVLSSWSVAVLSLVSAWRDSRPLAITSLLGAVLTQWPLFQTGDRGGALVYRHALAVEIPSAVPQVVEPRVPATVPSGEVVLEKVDDLLRWTPQRGDLGRLSASDAVTEQNGVGLLVEGRGRILLPGTYGNVQVNAAVTWVGFSGSVALVHHANGDTRGEFLVDTAGQANLSNRRNGAGTALDDGVFDVSNKSVLSVSASGKHLKGMVDGAMVVHGHAAALEPGQVGLELDGQGVLTLHYVEIIALETE